MFAFSLLSWCGVRILLGLFFLRKLSYWVSPLTPFPQVKITSSFMSANHVNFAKVKRLWEASTKVSLLIYLKKSPAVLFLW